MRKTLIVSAVFGIVLLVLYFHQTLISSNAKRITEAGVLNEISHSYTTLGLHIKNMQRTGNEYWHIDDIFQDLKKSSPMLFKGSSSNSPIPGLLHCENFGYTLIKEPKSVVNITPLLWSEAPYETSVFVVYVTWDGQSDGMAKVQFYSWLKSFTNCEVVFPASFQPRVEKNATNH